MKERAIEARYQAEKEVQRQKEEVYRLKKDNADMAMFNCELMIENRQLKKELEKANMLVDKLNDQVRVLIFERDIRLATIRELKNKLRDNIK